MTIEAANTRGVNNYYGVRTVDEARASEQWVGGSTFTKEFAFHADDYTSVTATMPKGAVITSATMEVLTAVAMTGTTPKFYVGTSGSAATNGVGSATATTLAVGVYKLSQNGTWAGTAPLSADTATKVELSSGGALTAGHVKIKVNYVVAGK